MIEITSSEHLAPCERDAWPAHRPFVDLTQDLPLARKFINVASLFFLPGCDVVYSGLARKVSPLDGEPNAFGPIFYVQLWDGDKLYRTVGYRNLGYTGILHMHVEVGECEGHINRDYIGDACKGIEHIPGDYATHAVAYVDDGKVEISFPYSGN